MECNGFNAKNAITVFYLVLLMVAGLVRLCLETVVELRIAYKNMPDYSHGPYQVSPAMIIVMLILLSLMVVEKCDGLLLL